MKIRLFLTLALIACLSGTAAAQDTTDVAISEGPSEGFFYLAPEVFSFFPQKDHLKDTAFVGGRLGYYFCPNFAAEIESGWVRFKIKDDLGTINSEPLMVNARINVMGVDNPWDVFIMGGLGAAFNRLNTEVPHTTSSNSFAIQTGLGGEWRFTQNLSLVVDLRYFWNDPDISFEGKSVGSLKNDSLVVGGGLSWNFR